jgi:hypothetical protein
MADGKNNIDSFLDIKIRNSLSSDTSPEFSFDLMKRIELEKEFAEQDNKTDKMVKYITGGLISFLIAVTLLLSSLLKTGKDGTEVSYFNRIIERFSDFIEYVSVMASENIGIAFNMKTGIIILLVMFCVFVFSFADRILLKKSMK